MSGAEPQVDAAGSTPAPPHEAWYEAAREQTPETLPGFLRGLIEDHAHDYNSIVHAVTAAAVAAAWAVERSPVGGITGFQASCVTMEFIQRWGGNTPPFWLLRAEDMLYPQYRNKFTTIRGATWEWLQSEARKRLDERSDAHPAVVAHWQSIASGAVPFGFIVRD